MKILIYIALYRRREIAPIYHKGLQHLIKHSPVTCVPFFIYTEEEDKKLAMRYFPDAVYVYAPNRPLGRKMNTGLAKAFEMEWDYLMGFGCDDILLPEYMERVKPLLESGSMCVGMRQLYYLDFATGRVKKSHKTDMVFGAARLIRRDIVYNAGCRYVVKCLVSNTRGDRRGAIKTIPKTHFNEKAYTLIDERYELWQDDKERALDASSMIRILEATNGLFIQTHIDDIYLLDIKTDENINKFDELPGEMVDRKEIAAYEVLL